MLKISWIMLSLLFLFPPIVFSAENQPQSIKELSAQADEILKQSIVTARRDIDVVFKLVDRLIEENQLVNAEKYINEGLKHFPWNLTYQMIYAELLMKSGNNKKAKEKSELVFQYAETDQLIERARKLLNKNPISGFKNISALTGTSHCVILVPLQECDKWLIARIKDDISTMLNIPVYIQTIRATYPSFSRDHRWVFINRIRKQLIEDIDDSQIGDTMKSLNLAKEDLDKEDNILKLMDHLLGSSGADKMAAFKENLKKLRGKNPQWKADQLQAILVQAVKPYRRKNVAYLGVTPVDIYSAGSNFIFGFGSRTAGIMSYHRFTADFNNEIPNQERLIKRTFIQSLLSVGHIFGVKECTNPTCAIAYPNSLAEHDAKNGMLCSECTDEFKGIFEPNK